MKLIYATCLAFISLSVASCKKDGSDNSTIAASTKIDVKYGTDARHQLDYYLPANRSNSNTKVMILIHGGMWSQGSKEDLTPYVEALRKQHPDYAFFNLNYRLASLSGNIFPTQETDIKSAVDFIYNNRSEYGVSDKFVLLGVSAGAHLALLQGNKHPSHIKAIINFFGPSDMADLYNNPPSQYVQPEQVAALLGGTPASNSNAYFQSSPINFISPQSPPTISFHGGEDPLVDHKQQTALHQKLDEYDIINEYVFYPNEGHGWAGATLVDSFKKVQIFIDQTVK